jgi:hypothetical protein
MGVGNGGTGYPNSGSFTVTGGDGTAAGTFTASGGVVNSVTITTPGSKYRTVGRYGYGDSLIFSTTTGGSGTGLTVGGTSTYMVVSYTIQDGCRGYGVLEGSATNAINNNLAGWTNLSTGVFDFGNYSTVVSPTRNATADVSMGGLLKLPHQIVSALPACVAGLAENITLVTDATSPTTGSTVVGSGSTHALVECNGSNWIVI